MVNKNLDEVKKEMNLHQRIICVMNDVSYLQKDKKVSTGGEGSYNAISIEKITEEVSKAMVRHGITIVPVDTILKREDTVLEQTFKDGSKRQSVQRFTTLEKKYRVTNADNPDDFIIASSCGTGVDSQDKSVGKAGTYAYKYLLIRLFAIATGEDTDDVASAVIDKQTEGAKEIDPLKEIKDERNRLFTKLFTTRDEFLAWGKEQFGETFSPTNRETLPDLVGRMLKLEEAMDTSNKLAEKQAAAAKTTKPEGEN